MYIQVALFDGFDPLGVIAPTRCRTPSVRRRTARAQLEEVTPS